MSNDAKSGEVMPRIKIAHLTTTDGILAELRSLYRDARRGEIQPGDATKLCYLLKTMSEIMTLRAMEERLDCLESGKPYLPRREIDGDHQSDQEAH
jgi:hypothetical protein